MNEKRKKIGVYIDYCLRIPSFNNAYLQLKEFMFKSKDENFELEGEAIFRSFWETEIVKPEVEAFYLKNIPSDDDMKEKEWRKYFFNEEHFFKFLEDFSYNLYVDAEVPFKKDIELLNITQKYLFDVVLIDEYLTTRKKNNTFFYLSKTRLTPYSVIFLKDGEKLDEEEYIGIWNPKSNKDQENGEGMSEFELWLKELEANFKNV